MKKLLTIVLCAGLLASAACTPIWADEDTDRDVVTSEESGGPGTSAFPGTSAYPGGPAMGTEGNGMGASQTVSRPPVTELTDYPLSCRILRITSITSQEIKSAPDETSASLATAYYDEEYFLLDDTLDGWYKVRFDGQEGYISKNAGSRGARIETSVKMQPGLSVRSQVVTYAYQLLGGKYLFGGRSAESGLDCSGFTANVYRNAAGASLAAISKEQAGQGTAIDICEIRPGDLIFYGADEASINHVAIYIGNDKILQAQGTGLGITVRPYDGRSDIFRVVSILPD